MGSCPLSSDESGKGRKVSIEELGVCEVTVVAQISMARGARLGLNTHPSTSRRSHSRARIVFM